MSYLDTTGLTYFWSKVKSALSNKVDKVSGKALSTNDYTTAEKTKLGATNVAYGTCATAAATAAKVITISGNTNWTLAAGSVIVVKFSYTNTASNPTFNVNSTGAKSVLYNTAVITTSNLSYAGYKSRYGIYAYDGTRYVFVGWSYDANSTYSNASLGQGYGTCSTAAATVAKVVTLSSYALTTGGVVSVKFTYAVPAGATMNINSKGAKAIYYRGAAITAGIIEAGDVATFIYNGSQYHLLTVDRHRFFSLLVPYGTAIPSSADLNTTEYMVVGNYYCSANATAKTLTNCPTTSAFMMTVSSPLSTTIDNETSKTYIYRLRKLQVYTGPEYVQYCSVGATAGTWTYGPWQKVIKSVDVVDNLTSTSTTAPLSAAQGRALKTLIDGVNATLPVRGVDYWTTADQAAIREDMEELVVAEVASRSQLKPEFANNISECTDTSKLYVLPDGYLYASVLKLVAPTITIENKTGGYWYSDEWNPTGTAVSNSGCCAKKTNLIPVTPGDQLKYKGYSADAVTGVTWLDSSQKFISNAKYNSTTSYTTVTAPANAAYVWFGSFQYTTSISNVVLDVQWVSCQNAVEEHVWGSTGLAFVPADYEDRIIELESTVEDIANDTTDAVADFLVGKKIVYDGDSICLGYSAAGGYPAQIADATGGEYVNQAVGGGRLCTYASGHSVSTNVSSLPTDGDLYCFQGGINDYWANAKIGTCTKGDYTGTLDATTICGALETIFRYALTTFTGKPICFVITHKIQSTAYTTNSAGHTFEDYRNAMIEVCEKYSIPYYDAFARSGLNGWNTVQNNNYLTGNSSGTADGIHPNAAGYKRYYTPQLLSLFREIMTVN